MRVSSLALLLLIVGAGSLPALADSYVYTYTGNDFTTVESPYTTSDFVSGEFTLSAPLAANEGDNDFVSFSFTDGVDTITNASWVPYNSIFDVVTGADGSIVRWDMLINGGLDQVVTADFDNVSDGGEAPLGGAYVLNDPGTWTLTVVPDAAAAPEPGSLVLLSTGMLAMAWFVHRRFARPFAGQGEDHSS